MEVIVIQFRPTDAAEEAFRSRGTGCAVKYLFIDAISDYRIGAQGGKSRKKAVVTVYNEACVWNCEKGFFDFIQNGVYFAKAVQLISEYIGEKNAVWPQHGQYLQSCQFVHFNTGIINVQAPFSISSKDKGSCNTVNHIGSGGIGEDFFSFCGNRLIQNIVYRSLSVCAHGYNDFAMNHIT